MQKHRVRASKFVLSKNNEPNSSVDAILNFFEEIDFLIEKRAISDEVVWQFFSYWIFGYFWATTLYRADAGKDEVNVDVFTGIEDTYKRLVKIDKQNFRKEGKPFKEMDKEDIEDFLFEESYLLGKPELFRIRAIK